MAESTPQLPEDDVEAAPQQPVQDENAPADGDKRSSSDRYEGQTYEQCLYKYVDSTRGRRIFKRFLDFHELSEINIVHLTNELAKYGQAMRKDNAAPQDIEHVEDLLHRYTTAVQDLVYWSRLPTYKGALRMTFLTIMRRHFPSIHSDLSPYRVAKVDALPKSTSGSIDPLRSFLKRVLPRRLTWTNDERKRRPYVEYWLGKTPEDISPLVDTLARFIVAITGGLSQTKLIHTTKSLNSAFQQKTQPHKPQKSTFTSLPISYSQ